MSRKILKIGTDIITVNNQVVSVTEDYPFWKVNVDTSGQYWNKFNSENTSTPYVTNLTTNITPIVGNSSNGFVSCDGVNYYSIPIADASIKKFNTQTQTLTYIGSFTGAWKFSGAVAVGKFIYFIPRDFASVIKLDTELDTFISIGSLSGTNKWGKPVLLPDGRIIAPRITANTVFTLDTSNDVITLINATNIQVNDNFDAGTWYYNGFVYGLRGLGSDSGRLFKMNLSNNSQTVIGYNFGTSIFQNSIIYDNITFVFTSSDIRVFDNISGTFTSTIPKQSGVSQSGGGLIYGGDGWIYQFSNNLLGANTRFNPKNFTVQTLFTNANASNNHNYNALCGKNGKIYILNGTTLQLNLLNPSTNDNININRILNRNVNKV